MMCGLRLVLASFFWHGIEAHGIWGGVRKKKLQVLCWNIIFFVHFLAGWGMDAGVCQRTLTGSRRPHWQGGYFGGGGCVQDVKLLMLLIFHLLQRSLEGVCNPVKMFDIVSCSRGWRHDS